MANEVTIKGTVEQVLDRRTVGQKATPVQEVIVECGGKYPCPIKVEFWGADSCDAAGELAVGEQVEIACYVNGREWQGKYFVSVRASKIVSAAEPQPKPKPVDDPNHPRERGDGEQLPF